MTPIKDLGAIGWVPDQADNELPDNAFTNVANVRFYRGFAEKATGYAQAFANTAIVPYFVQAFGNNVASYIAHAGPTGVYVDDGGIRTHVSSGYFFFGAPLKAGNVWTGGSINGNVILNHEDSYPVYWNGSAFGTMNGWGFIGGVFAESWRAKAIRPFRNFCIALGMWKDTTFYPHMVKWSDRASPGAIPPSWDHTDPARAAGEFDLQGDDRIVDGFQLGDMFVIYKERSMYAMTEIGGRDVFRIYRLPGEIGALARNCVAVIPAGHVVLAQGDVVLHQGQGPKSILDGRARKWLFDNLDTSNAQQSFVCQNPQKNEVWVCFPALGSQFCNKALVWNWDTGAISQQDIPNLTHATVGVSTFVASTDTFDAAVGDFDSDTEIFASNADPATNQARLYATSANSKIYALDTLQSAEGANISATLERTGIHLDNPMQRKYLRGAWPKIDGTPGSTVSIQLGASDVPDVAPTYGAAQTFTIGTSIKVNANVSGRYLAYRITSNNQATWRLRSIDLDIVGLGSY